MPQVKSLAPEVAPHDAPSGAEDYDPAKIAADAAAADPESITEEVEGSHEAHLPGHGGAKKEDPLKDVVVDPDSGASGPFESFSEPTSQA